MAMSDLEMDLVLAKARIAELEKELAEAVKHGRWVYDEHEMEWCCSECLRMAPIGLSAYILSDYCPKCGAKMDGGSDG